MSLVSSKNKYENADRPDFQIRANNFIFGIKRAGVLVSKKFSQFEFMFSAERIFKPDSYSRIETFLNDRLTPDQRRYLRERGDEADRRFVTEWYVEVFASCYYEEPLSTFVPLVQDNIKKYGAILLSDDLGWSFSVDEEFGIDDSYIFNKYLLFK